MAVNAIAHLENKHKVNNDKWLLYILKQAWIDIDVYVPATDVRSRVYGSSKGIIDTTTNTPNFQIKGFIGGNDFSRIDAYSSSSLSEAFLYTTDTQIKTGDTIVQVRGDNLSQRWEVGSLQKTGVQDGVVKRFALSSLVD